MRPIHALFASAAVLATTLPACFAGDASADRCPGDAVADAWIRHYVDQPSFAISLCIPPGFRPDGPLAWRRPSLGAAIAVNAGFSGPEDLEWPCGLDCPPIVKKRTHLRRVQSHTAVLETGLMAQGRSPSREGNVALLRIEVAPESWLVIRAVHRQPAGLQELTHALETVRIERLGLTESARKRFH